MQPPLPRPPPVRRNAPTREQRRESTGKRKEAEAVSNTNPASSSSLCEQDLDGAKELNPNREGCGRSVRGAIGATIFSQCGSGGVGGDILGNILLRLPRDSLLSCRLVSTSWLRVTSEPSFVRSYRALHPSLLGFFYHPSRDEKPVFVPTAQSGELKEAIDRGSGFTLDFLPNQSLHVVDSCSGLLLLADSANDHYYVCNPFTKQWAEIPTPPSANRDDAFLIGLSCSNNPPHFQVIRLVRSMQQKPEDFEIMYYNIKIERFSSGTKKWRTTQPFRLVDASSFSLKWTTGEIYIIPLKVPTLPVFVGGVLYWLNGEYKVLAFNEKRSDCVLVELYLPEPMSSFFHNSACLGKTEGRLCYALVNSTHLCIWVLGGDYPKLRWTLKHQIEWGPQLLSEIKAYGSKPPLTLGSIGGHQFESTSVCVNMRSFISQIVRPVGFHCTNSDIMFLSMRKKVFSYHLQTRELKELSSDGRHTIDLIFPCEMPEPPIPILGTTAEECSSAC